MAKFMRGLGKGLKAAGEGLSQLPSVFLKMDEQQLRADELELSRLTEEDRAARDARRIDLAAKQESRLGYGEINAIRQRNLENFVDAPTAYGEMKSHADLIGADIGTLEEFTPAYNNSLLGEIKSQAQKAEDEGDRARIQVLLEGILDRPFFQPPPVEPSGKDAISGVMGGGTAFGGLSVPIPSQGFIDFTREGWADPAKREQQEKQYETGQSAQAQIQDFMGKAYDIEVGASARMAREVRKAEAYGSDMGGWHAINDLLNDDTPEGKKMLENVLGWRTMEEEIKGAVARKIAEEAAGAPDVEYLLTNGMKLNEDAADFMQASQKLFSLIGVWKKWKAQGVDLSELSQEELEEIVDAKDMAGLSAQEVDEARRFLRQERFSEDVPAEMLTEGGSFDLALINLFQRLIDEGVAVRQGDIDLIGSVQQWPERLWQSLKYVMGKENRKLTDQGREDMFQIATIMSKSVIKSYLDARSVYEAWWNSAYPEVTPDDPRRPPNQALTIYGQVRIDEILAYLDTGGASGEKDPFNLHKQ